jgi:hypothetical protein
MKQKTSSSRKASAARVLDLAISEARDLVKLAKKKSKQAKAELKAVRAKLKAAKRARKEAAAKARAVRAAKRKPAAAKAAKKRAASSKSAPKRARLRLVRAPVPVIGSATTPVGNVAMDPVPEENVRSGVEGQQTA